MPEYPCKVLGCDVSFNQGVCDWQGAWEDGVRWVWIRFSQRGLYPPPDEEDWKDPQRHNNWINAGKTNMLRGAYSVWDQRGGHDAEDHARGFEYAFAPYWGKDEGELPHLFDLEVFPITWPWVKEYLIWLEAKTKKKPIIYSGSWVIAQAAQSGPIPDWLEDYEWYLTGYNLNGPDIWGPLSQLNITIVAWQQTSNWHVDWAASGDVDRGYWIKDYWRFMQMSDEKVVNANEIALWIQEHSFVCDETPAPPVVTGTVFDLGSPLAEPLSQWRISQEFNANYASYSGIGGHDGIDWGIVVGTPIFAAHDGEVTVAGYRPEKGNTDAYGCHVRIKQSGNDFNGYLREFTTIYAHMSQISVVVGQRVAKGQQLGLSGGATSDPCAGNSTGPHLHFGVIDKGSLDRKETYLRTDFMNPWIWLRELPTMPIQKMMVKSGVYLNARNKAGLTDSIVRYTMGPGQKFEVYEIVYVNGNPWGAQDVSRTTWNSIHADYVIPV